MLLKLRRQLLPLLEGIILAVLVVTFGITTVGISGDSMAPVLQSGERVIVPKYETWLHRLGLGNFRRGDIVYFRPPAGATGASERLPLLGLSYRRFFIKRIIAIAGDRVRIDQGTVYLNDQALAESYLGDNWRGSSSMLDLTIPKGYVFVLGDNRGPLGSVDSRNFGPIASATIAGRAAAVFWPPLKRNSQGHWYWNWRILRRTETLLTINP